MLEILKTILKRVTPEIDISTVNGETRLIDDLGFDSLAMLMLIMELEETFKFKFREFVRFNTVNDIRFYLESRV